MESVRPPGFVKASPPYFQQNKRKYLAATQEETRPMRLKRAKKRCQSRRFASLWFSFDQGFFHLRRIVVTLSDSRFQPGGPATWQQALGSKRVWKKLKTPPCASFFCNPFWVGSGENQNESRDGLVFVESVFGLV